MYTDLIWVFSENEKLNLIHNSLITITYINVNSGTFTCSVDTRQYLHLDAEEKIARESEIYVPTVPAYCYLLVLEINVKQKTKLHNQKF